MPASGHIATKTTTRAIKQERNEKKQRIGRINMQ